MKKRYYLIGQSVKKGIDLHFDLKLLAHTHRTRLYLLTKVGIIIIIFNKMAEIKV